MTSTHRLHARCACALGSGPFAFPGTERQYERSRPFVVRHLDLDIDLDMKRRRVTATAILSFDRVAPDADQLDLDAVGFDLSRVELEQRGRFARVDHEYDGDRLRVSVPKRLRQARVRIAYRATPARGLYFLHPDKEVPDRPEQVWSQCQDEDARHFIPCQDKPHVKMTTAIRAHVPRGFVVLSNGERLEAHTPRSKTRWSYRFEMNDPIPAYLITLVAGRFEVLEDRPARRRGAPDVPIAYYVPPGRSDDGWRSFRETPRMVELFGKLTGVPFPWKRYTQVVVSDFIFGGMENTTATTMYEHLLLDERAAIDVRSEDLVAHELAHHWFGNYVTCRDWSHGWLNEGFATFFEHLEREDRLGRDEYEQGLEADLAAYLAEADHRYVRPIVCRDYVEPIDLFDRHLYEKGGLVLHMLRRELGDALFWKGVGLYLERHAHGFVETNDLMRALEEVSGRSLERFFDQRVYRPGHPKLKVQIGWDDNLLTVKIHQNQKGADVPVFAFFLEVLVGTRKGGTQLHDKTIEARHDALVVRLPERPAWVAVDPEMRLMGDVTIEAPNDMLLAQLEHAPTARLRARAADALGRRSDPKTLGALDKCLGKKSESWITRAAAARSLGKIRSDVASEALERHAGDKHARVRRAVAAALGEFRTREAARVLSGIAKKDASYLVEAEAARSLGKTRDDSALKTLLSLIDRPSWADVKRAGVLDGLSELRSDDAIPHVVERTRYGVPTPGRRAAIRALSALAEDKKSRRELEQLLDDGDPHLRTTVVDALVAFDDPRAKGALKRQLERELDGRVARRIREALRELAGTERVAHKHIHDDVERLRRELAEIKARLAQVEAARGGGAPKKTTAPRRKAKKSRSSRQKER